MTHAFANGFPGRRGAEIDLDPAHHRPDRPDVEVGKRGSQVAHENFDEPGPIAPFERQLFVVDDYRSHESGNWVIG